MLDQRRRRWAGGVGLQMFYKQCVFVGQLTGISSQFKMCLNHVINKIDLNLEVNYLIVLFTRYTFRNVFCLTVPL